MDITNQENLEAKKEQGTQTQDDVISLSKADYEANQAELERLRKVERDYNGSQKEVQVLTAIKNVAKDNKAFFKYYKNDKRIAKEVAKNFWYDDPKDLYDELVGNYGDDSYSGNLDNGDDVDSKIKKSTAKELAKRDLSDFISNKKMDSKTKAQFMEEFNDLLGDRDLTPEIVSKYTQKARKLLWIEEKISKEDELRGAGVIGGGNRITSPEYQDAKPKSADIRDIYKKKKS